MLFGWSQQFDSQNGGEGIQAGAVMSHASGL